MQLKDRASRRIKLQELRALMAVVETGSMRKAALVLNTTQPSVSRAIAELEETLGLPLFERDARGVEPTQYGRALLEGSVEMFDDLRQAVQKIEFLANPKAGDVRIACGFHLAGSFVSSVVERVSERYPGVAFRILGLESTTQMYAELLARNVDLVIARPPEGELQESIGFEFLFHDYNFVVAGARHRLARRRRLSLVDLTTEDWILPAAGAAPGKLIDDAFRALGVDPPRRMVTATQPDVRLRLLATGRFLTVFPTSVLTMSQTRTDIKVLPVTPALPHVRIGLGKLKRRMLNPVTELVIQHIRDLAKPLARSMR
jgi:DNA-binding transcriptional LysR family regulator